MSTITKKFIKCHVCEEYSTKDFYYLNTRFYLCEDHWRLEIHKQHVIKSAENMGMFELLKK